MAQTKQCPRCLKEKTEDNFITPYDEPTVLCKACRKAIYLIERGGEIMYQKEVPSYLRKEARAIATSALNRGVINRPYCCEHCGKECCTLEMYIYNHYRPLSVKFVCHDCHRIWKERYRWIDRGVTEKFNIDGSER